MSWKRKARLWAFREWPPSLLRTAYLQRSAVRRLDAPVPEGPVRPYSSSSTNALLQERGTSHPARSEPGPPSHQRSRLLPGSEQRGLRPQRCTKEHIFFDTSFHPPNPPVTCRVCQLARQHIVPYREDHPRPRRQQGRDESAEHPRQDETTHTPSSSWRRLMGERVRLNRWTSVTLWEARFSHQDVHVHLNSIKQLPIRWDCR